MRAFQLARSPASSVAVAVVGGGSTLGWRTVAGPSALYRMGCRSPTVSLQKPQQQQQCALCCQHRAIGPRQYAPRGFREAAGRAPMTFEFGEECNDLAKVAHQTKNYGDAISLYDRALTMRREKYGPIHPKCAATLHNIGRVFLDMREPGAAENALTEAAAIYEETEGKQSVRYAESLALLALAYTHLNFLDEAEKAFRESIKVFRDTSYNHAAGSWLPDEAVGDGSSSSSAASAAAIAEPQKHPLASAAHALADCAQLFLLQGQESKAIAFLEEALEIRRYLYSRHNKYRPIIAQTLNKLCELKKAINDATGAEMCINECLEICVATLGRDSPATAQATSSKAALLAARRQFREARKLYEESTTTYAIALGKDAALFGLELIKLGRIQELCDDYATAQKTYERGIEVITKALGPDALQLAEAYTFLGSLLVKRQELDRAIDLFRDAVRLRKAKDRNDPQLAFLYQKLGDAYAMRRESHAEAYFLLAIEQFRVNARVEPLQRTFLTDVLDDLGLLYLEFHHLEKAESCLKEALDTRIEMLGENHATVAYSYSNFALLYLHREDFANCEKMCKAALDMYAKTARSNVLAQADVYTTYGQCCHLQKRYADALAWHEKALNVRRTRGENSETATAESLNHIARVYVSMKQYAPATKYLAEAKKIAYQYNADFTQYLRQEVAKTEQQIPPMEEWGTEDRAAATPALADSQTGGANGKKAD
ncbi:TPR-repeat-containing protein [Trypanosoma grayi]|uniref:TPR-repeat-containing protein n=1 Tax=Trypanosoma grayi TaxID=71804 RepID=UPI0004F415AE|nr:TPR-repeat-containing protein [Trypanosoma grayi]KEG09874.1 TPR-repeat-containing protein [Trypanosoma grayi]